MKAIQKEVRKAEHIFLSQKNMLPRVKPPEVQPEELWVLCMAGTTAAAPCSGSTALLVELEQTVTRLMRGLLPEE